MVFEQCEKAIFWSAVPRRRFVRHRLADAKALSQQVARKKSGAEIAALHTSFGLSLYLKILALRSDAKRDPGRMAWEMSA